MTRELGSGCGTVGRAVDSDTRGLQFESSRQKNLYWTFVKCIEKKKIKKKNGKSQGCVIDQWIRLRLPSCRPGFECQAHQQRLEIILTRETPF